MPYWRLSNFYLFYFASLGALVPYWGLYLQSIGFGAFEIGELMALLMMTKIISPNLWGWIADRTGQRMAIVHIGSLMAIVGFAGIFFSSGFWQVAGSMVLFSFFWNAVLPQFEAETLAHLGADHQRYSSIRLWGSVGFIIAVAGLGVVLDYTSAAILPWVMVGLLIAIFLSGLWVPERSQAGQFIESEPLRRILMRPDVMALLLVCLLAQASHGPYYTFYTIYMESYSYSRSLIGQLWALGVAVEVGAFMVMHRLMQHWRPRTLFLWALALTSIRWVLTALFPEWLWLMVLTQTLHAASFGIFHAVAIHMIHQRFRGRNQGMGQALYASVSFGMGGALGSYGAGYLWDGLGPASAYLFAALLALLALIIANQWLCPASDTASSGCDRPDVKG